MTTAAQLVAMAHRAVEEGWWYVLGSFISKGTESFTNSKLKQYSYNRKYEAYIRKYLKDCKAEGKTPMFSDCYGLIKGTIWYDEAKKQAIYQKDGIADRNANGAFLAAEKSGPEGVAWGKIGTIPEIPGICLYRNGHAGIYIGGGEFIHTNKGSSPASKGKVSSYPWTHWYKDTNISYEEVPVPEPVPEPTPEPVAPQAPSTISVGDIVYATGQGWSTSMKNGFRTHKFVKQKMKVVRIVSRGASPYALTTNLNSTVVTGWFEKSQIVK